MLKELDLHFTAAEGCLPAFLIYFLKSCGGDYMPGQAVGGKITKFLWGCGCLVVFKSLYGGLSEGPSIL